jgi:hypothetical protein
MSSVHEAFTETTKVLLGVGLKNLEEYEEFLAKYVPKEVNESGIIIPRYGAFKRIPKDMAASIGGIAELETKKITITPDENMASISYKWKNQARFIADLNEGINQHVVESVIYYNLTHAFRIIDCFSSKYIAYSFFSDNCDRVFGVSRCFDCSFLINAYSCRKVTRALEIDFAENCSDIMFCHNVSNVRDSLFCFNVKNLRYAILNNVVGKENFESVRALMIDYIVKELRTKKKLDLSIQTLVR